MLQRGFRWLVAALAAFAIGSALAAGCATGDPPFDDGDGGGSVTVGSGGTGGSAGLCKQDCEAIATPACLKSVCNDGMYQGTIGECVIVPDEGATCDDGMFCTIQDTCDAKGQCIGGPTNDCGMQPGQCKEIQCDEDTDSCGEIGSMNGAPCQDPQNLCLKGSTCSNGLCIGGTIDDCFFFPVSDNCHVGVCDPADGMCHEQIGNEGEPCVDPTQLCTVDKTCVGGSCVGGVPKNCSQLTMGCNIGVCDMPTGNCIAQAVMNGDPCDDLNACTTGELCNNGNCTGGAPVTTCVDGDNCCPSNCTAQNDLECNYPFGTARQVNGQFLNVQYHLCGNGNPGQCTAVVAQSTCTTLGLKVVSHASDGGSSVKSLGATSSCAYSVSYFTVNKTMPSTACLVAVSNLNWFDCCGNSLWHGQTMPFGAANQTFGYVDSFDSGYVASNPNVFYLGWGCDSLTTPVQNWTGCTQQYVACTQ
jgi:hypothetical protein